MPIDLGSVLKQIGRDYSQLLGTDGENNSFYYLVETADIDFRVDGRIGEGGLLPSGGTLPTAYYGQKFIVEDISGLDDVDITASGTIQNGDIIEKRADGWYIHLDVSAQGSNSPLNGTNGGALSYSKHDNKFYYYNGTNWTELGAGSLTGAAGDTWSIQFREVDGSLSGNAGLLYNNDTNQLVLGSGVVIAFGDGTTQGTARNFYGLTGPTAESFPLGMSGAGNTGDRLLLATGPSEDPFRNYVRFGNSWFQTGVVGIGQGPQGIQGTAGATGETGATGATGERGETGYGFTAAFVSGDGELYISTLFPSGESGDERSIGFVRGQTGTTGFGFTAAFVSGDGELYISTLFPSGESGNERSIGLVRGNDGAVGETGATGTTGFGFTAAFVSGDGELYISTLFPNGLSGNERSIGLVRGNDGAVGETGATGTTGFGFTAAFVSGDGNLYISTLFPSGESGDERSIGFVRGETGATGRFSIGLTVAETQFYSNNTALFVSGDEGIARKVAFLLDDGSLTFDYVKNIDIFNQSSFQYAVLSFSATSFPTTRRISSSYYPLTSSQFQATYRLGPPATANINTSEGLGFPIFFPTSAMNSVSGLASLTGVGGTDRLVTLTLNTQGNDANGSPRTDNTKTLTVLFRNDYISGMTNAPAISGGSTGMESSWWSTRDFGAGSSPQPRNETLSGYKVLLTPTVNNSFIYFAYPSRIPQSASLNGNSFYIYNEGGARQLAGGMVLQGEGQAVDAGGLSTLNYTNQEFYTEPYKVWRSEKSFSPGQGVWLEVG
jgi:hypothetical protein